MALDVYVGSLARYYAGDWESVGDRTVRKRGKKSSGQRARPVGDAKKDRERILAAVLAWRDTLAKSLAPHLAEPFDWSEAAETPWFTDQPGWDGFGSLVLWAAHAEQPALSRPATLAEDWDDEPALVRSNAEGFRSRYSHLVRNVDLWLPSAFDFTFEGEDVDGRRIIVGSSTTLGRQLRELNAATWKMNDGEMGALARQRPPGAALEIRARHAMAVMTGLVRQAVEHRLPMKLDY